MRRHEPHTRFKNSKLPRGPGTPQPIHARAVHVGRRLGRVDVDLLRPLLDGLVGRRARRACGTTTARQSSCGPAARVCVQARLPRRRRQRAADAMITAKRPRSSRPVPHGFEALPLCVRTLGRVWPQAAYALSAGSSAQQRR